MYEDEGNATTVQIISSVIESLPALPAHPKISRTALLLCGAYSEWLRNHPDKLFPAVKVLLANVNDVGLHKYGGIFANYTVELETQYNGELIV